MIYLSHKQNFETMTSITLEQIKLFKDLNKLSMKDTKILCESKNYKLEKILIQFVVSKDSLSSKPTYVKYENNHVSKFATSILFGHDHVWTVFVPQSNGSFKPAMHSVYHMSRIMHNKITNIHDTRVLNMCFNWKWYVILYTKDDVDACEITQFIPKRKKKLFLR